MTASGCPRAPAAPCTQASDPLAMGKRPRHGGPGPDSDDEAPHSVQMLFDHLLGRGGSEGPSSAKGPFGHIVSAGIVKVTVFPQRDSVAGRTLREQLDRDAREVRRAPVRSARAGGGASSVRRPRLMRAVDAKARGAASVASCAGNATLLSSSGLARPRAWRWSLLMRSRAWTRKRSSPHHSTACWC